jgi:hypothetical protein
MTRYMHALPAIVLLASATLADAQQPGIQRKTLLQCPFQNFLIRLSHLGFKGRGVIRGTGLFDVDA